MLIGRKCIEGGIASLNCILLLWRQIIEALSLDQRYMVISHEQGIAAVLCDLLFPFLLSAVAGLESERPIQTSTMDDGRQGWFGRLQNVATEA
jgi:hypothetical protein